MLDCYVSHWCIIPSVATSRDDLSPKEKNSHNTLRLPNCMRLLTHLSLFWDEPANSGEDGRDKEWDTQVY